MPGQEDRQVYICKNTETLQVMTLHILLDITENFKSSQFFSIMADETTDESNREQVTMVFHYVESSLTAHEEFVGLHIVPSIDANTLRATIHDVLLRLNLSVNRCRGQCYDSANNMSGAKKRFLAEAIRTTVVPISILIRTTVVPIRILIRTTGM